MRKIILGLFLLSSITFAEDFYLQCTLINNNGKEVSERYAKSHNEFDLAIVINNEELYFNSRESAIYERTTKSNEDIYLDSFFNRMYLIDQEKINIIVAQNFDKNHPRGNGKFSKKLYNCRKATYLEKLQMLIN